MPRFAANLSLMFNELPFLDRFAAAARAGFSGVECMFPYEASADEIRARLDEHGLEMVLFNLPPGDWAAGERGLTALAGREGDFQAGLDKALAYARALGCRRLHAMAGLVAHGADEEVFTANLRRAAREAAPDGVTVLVEPINTFDMPGYFLTRTEDAARLIERVGEPNVGLQLDLYHRHRMQGDALGAIHLYAPITRHYQIAGPPDRGEPDRGDIEFAPLLSAIDKTGYAGWIGCEYRPRAGTLAGLTWLESLGYVPG